LANQMTSLTRFDRPSDDRRLDERTDADRVFYEIKFKFNGFIR